MTIRALVSACLLSFGALTAAAIAQDHPDGLHIHDAYARAQGGIGGSGAVFFMVHNNTETDDRLIGAKTDVAERAELHTHAEDANGMMTMGEIEGGIPLAAGDFIELARGGDHVMLMGLTGALTDGDTITLTLTFEAAGDVTLQVPVDNERKPGEGGHDHGAMHKDGMNHEAPKE